MKISDLRNKDVIEAKDGKKLGYINDIEIDIDRGRVEAIIIPAERRLFSLFSHQDETILNWAQIRKIGVDVILVEQMSGYKTQSSLNSNSTGYSKSVIDDSQDFFDL